MAFKNLLSQLKRRNYARLFLNGKEIWKTCKTFHFSVGGAELGELKKESFLRLLSLPETFPGLRRNHLRRGSAPGWPDFHARR